MEFFWKEENHTWLLDACHIGSKMIFTLHLVAKTGFKLNDSNCHQVICWPGKF